MKHVAEQAMGPEMHKSLQEFWNREHRNQEKSTFSIARNLVLNGNSIIWPCHITYALQNNYIDINVV